MSRYDFRTPRLFVNAPLSRAASVALDASQVNYLFNVMRLKTGDFVLLFNGIDGEWRAQLAAAGKRAITAAVEKQLRPQPPAAKLDLLFAPLKHARLDYLVQKAVEMGVSRLRPIMTQHTQATRVNLERMRANVIEAAEQCGILTVPEVAEQVSFEHAVASAASDCLLIFCDEDADVENPIQALRAASADALALGVLIGPEGGFSEEERKRLRNLPNVCRISLGPRILRADTAAVAALTLVQAVLGDWGAASSA
jgi:16S rRNA (uracil1498-N3)-methyltransferase